MDFRYVTQVTPDFKQLSDELNQELQALFGKKQEKYQQYNLLDDIKDIVICYDGITPVGCASIKRYAPGIGEIKRVFIRKNYRGHGLSKKLLEELERIAREQEIKKLILETGKGLEAAMQLYAHAGYRITDNYGQYRDMKESICMEKILA
jgi:GNAT superfamily N-acetyltransferase